MTKENSNPPPLAPHHKKFPDPPELDEAFGRIEVFRLTGPDDKNTGGSPTKGQIEAKADWGGYDSPGSTEGGMGRDS